MDTLTFNNSYTTRQSNDAAQSNSKALALLWSTVTGAVMLASSLAGLWISALLVALGGLISVLITRSRRTSKSQKSRAADFSHASVCIWQLDREA